MAKKFETLRSRMPPARRARAATRASEVLAEMASASSAGKLRRPRPDFLKIAATSASVSHNMAGKPVRGARVTGPTQPDVAEIREAGVARNVDEVVASLPAVRRAKVEQRARELASTSTKPSPRGKKKRTVRRRSRATIRDGGRRKRQ